jgi:hypothetical protein
MLRHQQQLLGQVGDGRMLAMVARVAAALDERIGRALAVAAYLLRGRRDSRAISGGEGR